MGTENGVNNELIEIEGFAESYGVWFCEKVLD